MNASSSSKDYGDEVWRPQQGQFQDLWNSGQDVLGGGGNQQAGQNMFQQGQQAIGQGLDGGMFGNAKDTLNQQMNPGMNPMMDVYARQIGQQFNEQIMPQLGGGAALGGMRGGSRQGVAEGLAAARSGQQIQDFGAQLYSADQDRAQGAANSAANIYGQAAQQIPGMGQFGMNVPWYNLQQQGGLIGPAIMKDLGSKSKSSSSSSSYGTTNSTTTGGGGGGGKQFSIGL